MIKPLYNIRCCEQATIHSIDPRLNIKTRLADMGVCDGTEIVKMFESPLGSLAAYCIRGTTIALRDKDASGILVKTYE